MDNNIRMAKEIMSFIGRKFDELKDAVRNQRIVTDISGAATALDKAATNLESSSKELVKVNKSQDMTNLQKTLLMLGTSISNMAKSVGSVKATDLTKTNKLLSEVSASIKKIKLEVPKTDLSKLDKVVSVLGLLLAELKTHKRMENEDRTDEIIAAIKAVTIPEVIKLDKTQVSMMRGGGGGATASFAEKATSASIDMDDANTEYSYKFPANTIGFRVKLRAQNVLMQYSWETGKLPTSGDGLAYSTIQQNSELARDNLYVGGKTIYFQSPSASQVAEIESFQLG